MKSWNEIKAEQEAKTGKPVGKMPKGCLPVLIIILLLIGWMWHNAHTVYDSDIIVSAHSIVANKMLSPSGTDFEYEADKIVWHDGNEYVVYCVANAPNAFGVKLRQGYLVAFIQSDKDNYKCRELSAVHECDYPSDVAIEVIKRSNFYEN